MSSAGAAGVVSSSMSRTLGPLISRKTTKLMDQTRSRTRMRPFGHTQVIIEDYLGNKTSAMLYINVYRGLGGSSSWGKHMESFAS
jgi:hypothetical protein